MRLLLHRHQRPDPVHPGDGPGPSQAGPPSRWAASRSPADDQADDRWSQEARQMGRRLRRHRVRPDRGPGPDRARRQGAFRHRADDPGDQGRHRQAHPLRMPSPGRAKCWRWERRSRSGRGWRRSPNKRSTQEDQSRRIEETQWPKSIRLPSENRQVPDAAGGRAAGRGPAAGYRRRRISAGCRKSCRC